MHEAKNPSLKALNLSLEGSLNITVPELASASTTTPMKKAQISYELSDSINSLYITLKAETVSAIRWHYLL
jgi:hypothetical protein